MFCDACDTEIKESWTNEHTAEKTFRPRTTAPAIVRVKVKIEAEVASKPADVHQHLCRDCVLDAVATLDPRPVGIEYASDVNAATDA
jgi:hypothetical protein